MEDFGIGDEVMVKLFRYLLLSVVASKTLEKEIKDHILSTAPGDAVRGVRARSSPY